MIQGEVDRWWARPSPAIDSLGIISLWECRTPEFLAEPKHLGTTDLASLTASWSPMTKQNRCDTHLVIYTWHMFMIYIITLGHIVLAVLATSLAVFVL